MGCVSLSHVRALSSSAAPNGTMREVQYVESSATLMSLGRLHGVANCSANLVRNFFLCPL